MYNGDNFYNQNFSQYESGAYDKSNNMYLPCTKNSNCLKHYNYCFSSEEENCNKKAYYILTENNRKTSNSIINNKSDINRLKILNKFTTENSPYSNSQQILRENDYRSLTGKINNRTKQFTRINNQILNNHIYISLNPCGRSTHSNVNEMGNASYNSINKNSNNLKNNTQKNKKIDYNIYDITQNNNSRNKDSSVYYTGNNNISNSNYNQMFMKHKSQNYLNYDNQKVTANNLLFKNYTKNEIKSNVRYPDNSEYKDMEFDSLTYRPENGVSINLDNNNKSETIKKFEKYHKQRNINNFTNITNTFSSLNNTESNNTENNTYKPPVNKSTNYKKIEYFNINNRLMKRNIQNENKKKINLVINTIDIIQKNYHNMTLPKTKEINKIKKINLAEVPIFNDNFVEKNNHSFYEVKSFSKDTANQRNVKNKYNNVIINAISKKKSEDDVKRKMNNENKLKFKSNKNSNDYYIKENDLSKEDRLKLRTRKINLTELNSCIKNEGKIFIIQKEKSKKISNNNNNQSEISNNKENINININYNKSRMNKTNNNAFAHSYTSNVDAIKSEPKIKLNMDKNKLNALQNIKKIEKIYDKNPKIIINNNFTKKISNFVMEQPTKKSKCRKTSISSIYIEKYKSKPIHIKKSSTNYISYIPSTKDKKLSIKIKKKKKRKYSRQNMIQLMNIGNKSFQEDFPFKYNSYMSKINKILKPQIAFRTSLFAKKKPEKEKYYIVNFFYSENIKKKPDATESDF